MEYSGPTGIFINNEFVKSQKGKSFVTINPSNASPLAKVEEGDKLDLNQAVLAAQQAYPSWKKKSGAQRAAFLERLANEIDKHREELAQIESLDNGMNINISRAIMSGISRQIRHVAGWGDKLYSSVCPLDPPNFFAYTLYEPLGVVGIIVPWNFPTNLLFWKLAPALVCGNTVVIKPSEKTPLTALKIGELIVKAKFPPGVVNIVPGFGPTAGEALARHPLVRKISFTGSVNTGKGILKAAAESNLKKVTLELGGKSPVIVCDDCDLDEAVFTCHNGIFLHQGQVCVAGSRVFVQDTIYDQFLEKSIEMAKDRLESVGDAQDESSMLGPLVDDVQFKKVQGMISKGVEEGAKLVFGGQPINRPGYFLQPTLFSEVKDEMSIAREEIFGPVQSIFKFSDLKEALKRANNTEFGLGAGIFTKDVGKALALASEVEAGIVWINTYGNLFPQAPFGGYKQSGIGRENGMEVFKEYTQVKTVVIQKSQL